MLRELRRRSKGQNVVLREFMTELVALIRRISDLFRRRKSFPDVSRSSEVVGTRVDMDFCGFDDFITFGHSASHFGLEFLRSPVCAHLVLLLFYVAAVW